MALYFYQALSRGGKSTSGQVDASSIQAAREQILKLGLYPVKISLPSEVSTGFSFKSLFAKKVDVKDKIFFTKQLALLLKSGIPLLQALELLVEQTEGQLKTVVIKLKDDIKEGRSLADSLEKFPKIFDSTYTQLVRAGEASGKLEIILLRLTSYLERRQEIARRISKAISYPLFQLGFIILIVGGLLAFVVPKITGALITSGAEIPLPTRILLKISDILTGHYIIILLSIIAIYVLYRWWKSTASGKRTIDSLKLKIPVVKYFSKMGTVVQFSRTLGMLVESGVNLPEALYIVGKIVDNEILAQTLNEARENIMKQGRIAEYLKKTNIFPSTAIYLINSGEQSGSLGTMLLTVAEYYEMELTDLSDSLSSKLGPAMTILMALIVGFIVISIVVPLINLGGVADIEGI